jgi:glycosyltransferase involved in cell wall biosynthesis
VRLLYVTGGFPRVSETFVLNEVLGQLERGHDVRVVSLRGGDPGGVPEAEPLARRVVDVGRVPVPRRWPGRGAASVPEGRWSRRLFAMAAAGEVVGRLDGFVPDLVHAHFLNLPTLVGGTVARLLRVPYTFTGHADDFMVDVPDDVLRRRVLHADAGFVVSEAGRRQVVHRARLDAGEARRLTLVRAVVRPRVPPRTAEPPEPLTVVTVARLVPIKGVDASLRAFARIRERHPDARYWIVGDGPERPALEALVRSLGLSAAVTLHGPLGNTATQELIARAHIAVLACRYDERGAADGVPVFLMEAGALGLPVVSTDVTGVPELVHHGAGGLVVPAGDDAALAEALLRLAADPSLRTRLGEGLGAAVAGEFSPERQLDRMHDVWHRLLSSRR